MTLIVDALVNVQRVLGCDHPDVLNCCYNVGFCLLQLGRTQDAVKYLSEQRASVTRLPEMRTCDASTFEERNLKVRLENILPSLDTRALKFTAHHSVTASK